MTAANRFSAPSRGAAATVEATYPPPTAPPSQPHHGTEPSRPVEATPRVAMSATTRRTSVPTANEIAEARIGPPTNVASRALIPAWNGSALPARTASRRKASPICSAISRRYAHSPASDREQRDAELRSHRPAGSALHAAAGGPAARREPRLRVRVDVRLAHPLAGELRAPRDRRRPDGEDQARPLRHQPRDPRPDDHGQLVRDDAGHHRRPDGDGHRPGRLLAAPGRPQAGQGRRVRAAARDDQGADERP